MPRDIRIHASLQELSIAAAEIVIQSAQEAIAERGRFSISLSGGSTPRALYTLLAQAGYRERIQWSHVDIFWGDERCVPPEHPDSDYGMARAALLDHLPAPFHPGIYRMEGELLPELAARNYEIALRSYFGSDPVASFDLLLLGMGEDGHTASLFPGTQPIHETERWVCAHYIPRLSAFRLTLTPPILNRSRTVLFLATGRNKAAVLTEVLFSEKNLDRLPSQVIQPYSGNLIWLTDQEAASKLPPTQKHE